MPLCVAVDIGLRNMSLCALHLPPLEGSRPPRCLEVAKTRLRQAHVEAWETSALVARTAKEASFVAQAKAVACFVNARRDLFTRADCLIVEHQMAPKMRCLAAALLAAVAAHVPELPMHFQMSSAKLAWDDLQVGAPGACLETYNGRKKAAVSAAHWLLDLEPQPLRKRKRPEAPLCPGRAMATVLSQSDKQDDLADSLLHLLAFGTHAAPKKRQRKAPVPGAATVGAGAPAVEPAD